jgi:hypothetical protein
MNEHSENEQFARLIVALEPWLIQVVIIGGWAHRLYRLHPSAQHVEYLALTTLDTDIAVDPRDVRIANPASFLAHKVLIHTLQFRPGSDFQLNARTVLVTGGGRRVYRRRRWPWERL